MMQTSSISSWRKEQKKSKNRTEKHRRKKEKKRKQNIKKKKKKGIKKRRKNKENKTKLCTNSSDAGVVTSKTFTKRMQFLQSIYKTREEILDVLPYDLVRTSGSDCKEISRLRLKIRKKYRCGGQNLLNIYFSRKKNEVFWKWTRYGDKDKLYDTVEAWCKASTYIESQDDEAKPHSNWSAANAEKALTLRCRGQTAGIISIAVKDPSDPNFSVSKRQVLNKLNSWLPSKEDTQITLLLLKNLQSEGYRTSYQLEQVNDSSLGNQCFYINRMSIFSKNASTIIELYGRFYFEIDGTFGITRDNLQQINITAFDGERQSRVIAFFHIHRKQCEDYKWVFDTLYTYMKKNTNVVIGNVKIFVQKDYEGAIKKGLLQSELQTCILENHFGCCVHYRDIVAEMFANARELTSLLDDFKKLQHSTGPIQFEYIKSKFQKKYQLFPRALKRLFSETEQKRWVIHKLTHFTLGYISSSGTESVNAACKKQSKNRKLLKSEAIQGNKDFMDRCDNKRPIKNKRIKLEGKVNQFSLRKYTFFSKVLEAGVTSFAFEYMLSQWDAGAIKFLHGTSDDKRYDAMAIHLIADSQAIRDHHIVIWDKEHKHLSCLNLTYCF